jgi:hypothetical protein
MGIFDGLFGTSRGSIETQGTNSPWAPAQPHYKNIFSGAEALYNQGPTQAQSILSSIGAGQYLNPNSNPFLAQSVSDALGLAGSAFAGQYGGQAGSQLGNSGYQEGLARTLGNVATNAYSNAYGQERQHQMAALSMDPAWANLQQYKGAITTPFGQTTQQQPYFQNNTANTLGTLGTVGSLAMMFSDERVKENIERVGTHESGVGLYKYNYIGDGRPQIGVLAQEFAQVKPDAVYSVGGVLAVDYNKV